MIWFGIFCAFWFCYELRQLHRLNKNNINDLQLRVSLLENELWEKVIKPASSLGKFTASHGEPYERT